MYNKPVCHKALLLTLVIPVSFATANPTFSMDDINASLQVEYQQALQTHKKRKARPKKSVAKKARPQVRPQVKRAPKVVQRRVAPVPVRRAARPVRQPAAPRPEADDLFEAATYGNVGLITRLLQQGLNVNSANSEGETALHMAAANGRYPAVIYLINHGGNIHARTRKNWQAIHHAARFRKANIANYLIKKGASPHARTSDGLSAIDMARSLGDQYLLRLFGAR